MAKNTWQDSFSIVWDMQWCLLFRRCVFTFIFVQNALASQDIPPVFLQSFIHLEGESSAWKAPDYSGQHKRVGYQKKNFSVEQPRELKRRVDFWTDIYAKYDSNQGLLHDAREIDLVYKVINLPTVESTGLSKEEVQKLREEKVKSEKKKVQKTLLKLQIYQDLKKSPESLSTKEKEIWQAFKSDKGKRKFYDATLKNRLRLQLGQKDHFQKAIFFSGRYLPEIERIFAKYNLPKELSRLPFVESSFNVLAQSKVGASGIWQFMRSTGRQYLKMNRYIDDRNDPFKATEAAAKLLKWGYTKVEAWPLAVTGYNYGPTGIARLSKKHRTKSLAHILKKEKSARFGFASQNFYASFLAALHVEKNANSFFKKPRRSLPLEMKKVKLTKHVGWKQIVKWFDGDENRARTYNPFISYRVRKGRFALPRKYEINVPRLKWASIRSSMKRLPASQLADSYRVRRGDTLSLIAARFGVGVRSLMRKNRLRSANRIHVGQVLRIP